MLTYLDSNVLVQAATGANRAIQLRALAIITDPSRQFASSLFSRMEIIPLAIHFGRTKERLFYETFFFGAYKSGLTRLIFMTTLTNLPALTLWGQWMPFTSPPRTPFQRNSSLPKNQPSQFIRLIRKPFQFTDAQPIKWRSTPKLNQTAAQSKSFVC